MCPANGLLDCLCKARPTWSYERRPPYQERGSREGYFHQSWLLPRVRLQERQGAASSSVSPSRGEELRLLPALETDNLAEAAFLSKVTLSSAPADPVEEERTVSPSVHGESGSLARAAHTGLVDFSESEDETMGAVPSFGQDLPTPRWNDGAQAASLTNVDCPHLGWCSGGEHKSGRGYSQLTEIC